MMISTKTNGNYIGLIILEIGKKIFLINNADKSKDLQRLACDIIMI